MEVLIYEENIIFLFVTCCYTWFGQSASATTEETNINPQNIVGTQVASINASGVKSSIYGAEIPNPGPGKNYIAQCTKFSGGSSAEVGFMYLAGGGAYVDVGRAYFSKIGTGVYNNFKTVTSHTGPVRPQIVNQGSSASPITATFVFFRT